MKYSFHWQRNIQEAVFSSIRIPGPIFMIKGTFRVHIAESCLDLSTKHVDHHSGLDSASPRYSTVCIMQYAISRIAQNVLSNPPFIKLIMPMTAMIAI